MEKTQATKNLSQWFNLSEQKPWEHGVYQVQTSWCAPAFAHSFWDGHKFCHAAFTFNPDGRDAILAKEWRHLGVSSFEKEIRTWRGLSSDPSAKHKARGNRKVTRYVVMVGYGFQSTYPAATFESKENAMAYIAHQEKSCRYETIYIDEIRFRTPEAD